LFARRFVMNGFFMAVVLSLVAVVGVEAAECVNCKRPSPFASASTAQGVAEIQARQGRVGHYGGNRGHEGCGSGPTPEAALSNCCYSRNGWPVIDQGVAYGHGRWFACRRYGR
jgi:hypothetical protein